MVKDNIINVIDNLSLEMQKKLLDYAMKLQFQDKGINGKELIKYFRQLVRIPRKYKIRHRLVEKTLTTHFYACKK